VISRG